MFVPKDKGRYQIDNKGNVQPLKESFKNCSDELKFMPNDPTVMW